MSFAYAILIFGIHLNKGICLLFYFSFVSFLFFYIFLVFFIITISINAELKGIKCSFLSTRIMWGIKLMPLNVNYIIFFLNLNNCHTVNRFTCFSFMYSMCVNVECVKVSVNLCAYVCVVYILFIYLILGFMDFCFWFSF